MSKVVEFQPAAQTLSTSSPNSNGVLSSIERAAGLSNSGQGNERRQGVFVTRQETTGVAQIANDNGFSTWLTVHPSRRTDFQIGYSRSATYQLNSMFFGVGFRAGR